VIKFNWIGFVKAMNSGFHTRQIISATTEILTVYREEFFYRAVSYLESHKICALLHDTLK
jgi:hypothetical protein